MCKGRSTGENTFNVVHEELTTRGILVSFQNILVLGSDNRPVMSGKKKGVFGFMLKENKEIYFAGCPCHLSILTAEKSAAKLSCKVNDFLTDLFYYLDKSSVRKELLSSLEVMN